MEYVTSCYRQQGENTASLLLQQYLCRRMSVCFGCIGAGPGKGGGRAGGYLTRRMLVWCRGFPWMSVAKRREKYSARIRRELEEVIGETEGELRDSGLLSEKGTADLAGMLCTGENVILFGSGGYRICLLNTVFGRGHIRELSGTDDNGMCWFWEGSMERNVGLLLATESFYDCLPKQMLREVLNVNETLAEEQADLRLKELAREGERRGGGNMAAILLYGR